MEAVKDSSERWHGKNMRGMGKQSAGLGITSVKEDDFRMRKRSGEDASSEETDEAETDSEEWKESGRSGDSLVSVRGAEVLDRVRESEASDWLAAPPALLKCAKQASEILFSLSASNFGKGPLSKLYTEGFDTEQIWQQIDLQSHPVISYVRRKIKGLERSPNEEYFLARDGGPNVGGQRRRRFTEGRPEAVDETESEDASDDEEQDDGDEANSDLDSPEVDDDEDGEDGGAKKQVEDEFFRIGDMEKFLDRADAGGVFGTGGDADGESPLRLDDGEDAGDSEEDDDGLDAFDAAAVADVSDEGEKDLAFGTYEEFFGRGKNKKTEQRNLDLEADQEERGRSGASGDELRERGRGGEMTDSAQPKSGSIEVENLSTHERRQERMEKRMKKLEEANIGNKEWTELGEVTAKKRPVNSALEVELDFEHNVRPPPVITEEVTTSLEDMIRSRIAEGRYDDALRKSAEPISAPRERAELDESKSQRGLGEIYEAEYMQNTGLAVAPTPTSEALKDEARSLFKALCGRLDALTHFHFAVKPVIEDMGVRADVPALAMEEVAPLAVSDVSMLAPEEIFTGEDAIKGEGELTPAERKRRRAQKKRKRKGEMKHKEAERIRKRIHPIGSGSRETQSTPDLKAGKSGYSKSTKVFAQLESGKGGESQPRTGGRQAEKPRHASFLKL